MNIYQSLKTNILASIPVFLVAIPLCLGIALATNTPLFSGMLTGVIGGIVVGLISASRVSVSGPAAGMIAVVISTMAALGSYPLFLLALCFAGVLQLLAGFLRVGFVANYVPSAVIKGLLAAIGILIIIKQLPLAFGFFSGPGSILYSIQNMEEGWDIHALSSLFQAINPGATIISIVSLLILIFWEKVPYKWIKSIPASCVVVLVAILISIGYAKFFPILGLESYHLVNIPILHSSIDFIAQLKFPNWQGFDDPEVYLYGAMLAIVASLETLLNLEGIEKIDKRHRYCSRDQELVAQGAGNLISGLLGGLPITSVIVRSSVNVYAGATSRISTITHGILLFLSLAFTAEYLNYIPIAALASILIYTGFKLASPDLFKSMYKKGFRYFTPFLITTIAIIASDLLNGILIGLAVSIFFILKDSSKNCFTKFIEKHPSGTILRLMLPQHVTFLNRAAIVDALNILPKESKVVIDASTTDYIEEEILELLNDEKTTLSQEKSILFNFEGFKDHYAMPKVQKFVSATTYDVQARLTPDEVLTILKEGNTRFVDDTPIKRNYKQHMQATEVSQHPIGVVLGCIDSRVPVEEVFNLGLGDLFVARVAGNIANEDILGSIEFACEVAGAKLIVVLGHKSCGAVKAACSDFHLGHLTQLIDKIKPAVNIELVEQKGQDISDSAFVTEVTKRNIELTKQWIYAHSEVIKKLIDAGKVKLVGAYYDISTGKVVFDEN